MSLLVVLFVAPGETGHLFFWLMLASLLIAVAFGVLAVCYKKRYVSVKRLYDALSEDVAHSEHTIGNAEEKSTDLLQEESIDMQLKVKSHNDALMERIQRCVYKNLSNPDFNVEMLTREAGISRSQLHRKMKEMTGTSTAEYLRNIRLEQGARLIREKKINITQVAYAVGFNNQAHFSTVFKRHFGVTPTEYSEKKF